MASKKQDKSMQKFFFPREERTVEAEDQEKAIEAVKVIKK